MTLQFPSALLSFIASCCTLFRYFVGNFTVLVSSSRGVIFGRSQIKKPTVPMVHSIKQLTDTLRNELVNMKHLAVKEPDSFPHEFSEAKKQKSKNVFQSV